MSFFFLCVLGVLAIALAPIGASLDRLTIQLHDFFSTELPVAPAGTTPESYGRLLNVALFVPVGLTLAWWLDTDWGWALPLALGLSMLIEVVQGIPGNNREATLNDVACNAIGACVGVVVVAGLRARSARSRRRRPPG